MSLTYSIDSARGILRITVIGEPGLSEQADLARKWTEDPLYRNGMPILLDNRQRSEPSTASEIRKIAQEVEHSSLLSPGTRCAVLVPHQVEFGMTRMFAMLSEKGPLATRPFHDENDAIEWLLSDETP